MNTITAKELRDNLSKIISRAMAGERIEVIYRSRPVFDIVPKRSAPKNTGAEIAKKLKTLAPLLAKNKGKTDELKTMKELYHESLDEKYKHKYGL